MRALFWLLGLFAAAVGLVMVARHNDAYVLVHWAPWRVDFSLNLFVVVLGVAVLLLYFGTGVLDTLLAMPERAARFRARQKRRRAVEALRDAARLYFEGRFGHAQRSAKVAAEAGESPGLAALIGARAAHAMRDGTRAAQWLQMAAHHDGDLRAARLMTEADLLIDRRDYDEALARIDQLQAGGQRHVAALRLALRAYQGKGDWAHLLRVARLLEKHKALTAEQAAPIKRRAHHENIVQRRLDADALNAYWRELPAQEKQDARLLRSLVEALIAAGDTVTARRLLEQQLDREWDSELVRHYADCGQTDRLALITQAERWLKAQPRDAQLLLVLGRLCRAHELWGKAQSYLEASAAVAPVREVLLELALLYEHLQRPEQAQKYFRLAALAA